MHTSSNRVVNTDQIGRSRAFETAGQYRLGKADGNKFGLVAGVLFAAPHLAFRLLTGRARRVRKKFSGFTVIFEFPCRLNV
jgi:hypothetical protein